MSNEDLISIGSTKNMILLVDCKGNVFVEGKEVAKLSSRSLTDLREMAACFKRFDKGLKKTSKIMDSISDIMEGL